MALGRLKRVQASQVTLIKLRNRRGYAAICLGNLTEGRTAVQAFQRLLHPLRRMGYALPERAPGTR